MGRWVFLCEREIESKSWIRFIDGDGIHRKCWIVIYIFECVKNGHVCITAGVGRDGWGDAKGVFDF